MGRGKEGPAPKLVFEQPSAGRIARHYIPVVAIAAIFVVVIATMPSTVPTGSGLPGSSSTPTPSPSGITPAAPPDSPGIAVSGVHCKPGARQVTWSDYAPLCEPAWHGDNGGSTSPGVTSNTITVTYRYAVSEAEKVLYSLVAPSVVGTNSGTIATMEGYIKLFNRTFELYGRHVVLKPFTGKGDFLQEDEGNDASAAQADAAHAKALGAFADVSLLASTPLYDQDLAKEGVVAIGASLMTQQWFEQYAPYEFSPSASCNELAQGGAEFVGRSMAGMPAIYAGNPAMHTEIRRFGLIYPSVTEYTACADTFVHTMEDTYHVTPAKVVAYSINLGELGQEATSIIAQMKAANVTTVICACDPVSPILLTESAVAQNYYPEWFSFNIGNSFARLPDQKEWAHAFGAGTQTLPLSEQEAYQAWELADPGTQPPSPTFATVYVNLLLLFDALQAAGPDLTPQTLERGFFHLPESLPGGEFGTWVFGKNVFAPTASTGIVWWDPQAISVSSGKKGAWLACNGGKQYGILPGFQLPPAHQQLQCFGSG